MKQRQKKHYKLNSSTEITENEDILILPYKYFYPLPIGLKDKTGFVTENTYTIHWWDATWTKSNIDCFLRNKHKVEYNKLINLGFKSNRNKLVHFGKRKREAGFLKDLITSGTNISWFREQYPEEQWSELVLSSRKEANVKVMDYFRKRSNIRGAREEMERTLSARAANKEFYGVDDQTLTTLREEQKLVLEAIRKPRIILEAAAFVWMVRVPNENK